EPIPLGLEERRAYLKAQRDKLISMKKAEREKRLESAVKKHSNRPKTAKAAKSSFGGGMGKQEAEEEDATLRVRRELAKKLREELNL
ncbi:unnamed protein product, partial [Darwinula stevensoni]